MRLLSAFTALTVLSAAIAQAAIPGDIDRAFAMYTELPSALLPILENVKDKESAEEAAPLLNQVLPQVYDARTNLMKIENLSPAVQAEVLAKYEKKMRSEWGKVYEHIFRLQSNRCYDSLALFKQFHTLCMILNQ